MRTLPRPVLSSLLAVVLLVLAGSRVAHAGEAEDKAVSELVHLVMPSSSYESMLDQMATQLMATFQSQGMKVPTDGAVKLRKSVMEAMPYDEMVRWTTEIYAARFTLAEIKELTAFYRTPVGKKAARLFPEIAAESAKKAGLVLPQRLPAAMKKNGLIP